ncbi:MAG: hypothetical protein WC654_06075 [Patescibacteria group bacterium]
MLAIHSASKCPFTDPPDHVRPYRFTKMIAPGLTDPWVRKFIVGLMTYFCVICFITFARFLPPETLRWFLYGLAFSPITVWLLFVKSFDALHRHDTPMSAQLSMDIVGRELLAEGDAIHERRARLLADWNSPRSILKQFVLTATQDRAEREPVQGSARLWRTQLNIERNLLDRQLGHLNGQRVATLERPERHYHRWQR